MKFHLKQNWLCGVFVVANTYSLSKLSKISCINYDYDSNQYLKHLTIFKIFAKLRIRLSTVKSFDVNLGKNPESGCFAYHHSVLFNVPNIRFAEEKCTQWLRALILEPD